MRAAVFQGFDWGAGGVTLHALAYVDVPPHTINLRFQASGGFPGTREFVIEQDTLAYGVMVQASHPPHHSVYVSDNPGMLAAGSCRGDVCGCVPCGGVLCQVRWVVVGVCW